VSQARARLEDARTRLQNSAAQFEEVVGRRPGDLEPIDAVSGLPGQQGAASDRAASANPELAASKLAAEAASDEIRRREGQLLPSLSLRGTLSHREKTSSEESEVQDARVTLELQIPLYQAGEATSRVRQAKQRASQRRIEVSETERRVRQEAISAWNDFTGAQARIDQLEAAVESARASLEGVREEARAGARLVLDILDAQQELVNAQVNLVRARADRQIAAFALRRAVGNLSARALELPVDYYQPERNYEAVDGLWWGLSAGDGGSGSERGAE
jgi:outer membrane protein TolC